jgi:manganese transport protein
MIMQGFVGFRIPVWVRRLVTMAPAFAVVALGVNVTTALVISQVVLSIALPLPMIALLMFTRRPDIMGPFASGPVTHLAALTGTVIVLALNALLIAQVLGVPVPGLGAGGMNLPHYRLSEGGLSQPPRLSGSVPSQSRSPGQAQR